MIPGTRYSIPGIRVLSNASNHVFKSNEACCNDFVPRFLSIEIKSHVQMLGGLTSGCLTLASSCLYL